MSRESTTAISQQPLSSSSTANSLSLSSGGSGVPQSAPQKLEMKVDKTISQQSIEQKKEEGLDEKALAIKTALLRGDTKPFCAIKDRREVQEQIIADIDFAAMNALMN